MSTEQAMQIEVLRTALVIAAHEMLDGRETVPSDDYVDEIVDGWIAQAEATEECIAALRDLLPDAAEEDEL